MESFVSLNSVFFFFYFSITFTLTLFHSLYRCDRIKKGGTFSSATAVNSAISSFELSVIPCRLFEAFIQKAIYSMNALSPLSCVNHFCVMLLAQIWRARIVARHGVGALTLSYGQTFSFWKFNRKLLFIHKLNCLRMFCSAFMDYIESWKQKRFKTHQHTQNRIRLE